MDDLLGKSFGEWIVLSRDESHSYKANGRRWICRCSCGAERSVLGKHLKNGKSKSCGSIVHREDLIGKHYNKWIVLGRDSGNNKWRCRCECGTIKTVNGSSLKNGKSTSCGCSRRIDLTGKQFGSLTVDHMIYNSHSESYCSCSCSCGTTNYIIRASGLVTGNTASCGCKHSPDLTGKIFNRLTVIEEVDSNTTQRQWLCRCACGNLITVASHTLVSGHTQSCGCLRRESNSLAEVFVESTLRDKKINFITEHKFEDCIGVKGKRLRFDFYLPDHRIVFECDGEQHYHPIEYFGGEESFNTLRQNDEIKNSYCIGNNIHLIRLPYFLSDEEKEHIIKNALMNPVTTTV